MAGGGVVEVIVKVFVVVVFVMFMCLCDVYVFGIVERPETRTDCDVGVLFLQVLRMRNALNDEQSQKPRRTGEVAVHLGICLKDV